MRSCSNQPSVIPRLSEVDLSWSKGEQRTLRTRITLSPKSRQTATMYILTIARLGTGLLGKESRPTEKEGKKHGWEKATHRLPSNLIWALLKETISLLTTFTKS